MRQRRRRAIEAWEQMQPHLGPIADPSPGSVHRIVVFLDRIEHLGSGRTLATGMVAGVPVLVDLQGRKLEADRWACLDVTDPPADEPEDPGGRRRLTLVSIVADCPAETPEWAVRRHL